MVTTIVVTGDVAPTPAPAPTQAPGESGGGGYTATNTVESTATVYVEGGDATEVSWENVYGFVGCKTSGRRIVDRCRR